MVANIRAKQTDVLTRVLSLNNAAAPGKDTDTYKVLILDRFTKDVVAPLLRLNELRKHGVTLHLMLEAERQPIPDVPAVYLVQPTQANLERIAADAIGGLYESMHLNFTTSLPSRQLETLAAAVVRGDAAQRVAKLHDQYLAFIALEPTLFSLGLPEAYVQLNDPSAQDSQIEAVVASIVDGLFSVCVTLGVVPVIRCLKGGVAEHVAAQLDQKLRDALRSRNNLFVEGVLGLSVSLTRPLLCLFDRNFDMASALQHSWTYKPMVHDALGMQLNRITLSADAGSGPGSAAHHGAAGKRTYDVDESDFFWEACGTHPFPRVAEEVETQLQRYKTAVEEINKRTAAGAQEGEFIDADELLCKNTQHLMAAVSSLPELQEQKKTLDKHTNLATALLGAIKSRGLDGWHTTGEEVLCGKADLAAVLRMLGGARGSPADRLRLAVLWMLATEGVPSEADCAELEGALRAGGAEPTALAYVRTLKRNNLVGARLGGEGGAGASGPAQGGAALLDYVAKSVKTLLAGNRQPPLTVAMEALMEGRQGSPEHESFLVLDPKAPAGRVGPERAKGPFREAMVFIIGGGNYMEREVLNAWAARGGSASASSSVLSGGSISGSVPRHVLYGATEILSGEQFVGQLAELGRRSGLGPGGVVLGGGQGAGPAQPP